MIRCVIVLVVCTRCHEAAVQVLASVRHLVLQLEQSTEPCGVWKEEGDPVACQMLLLGLLMEVFIWVWGGWMGVIYDSYRKCPSHVPKLCVETNSFQHVYLCCNSLRHKSWLCQQVPRGWGIKLRPHPLPSGCLHSSWY